MGLNQVTGLYEFWDVTTGEEPYWEGETGLTEIDEDSGLVWILLPAVKTIMGAEILAGRPGLIIAEGTSDVHVRTSALHSRNETGAIEYDGWWTVTPTKLTTAPLVGARTAAEVMKRIGADASSA